MPEISEIINEIRDSSTVIIDLPLNGGERKRLTCVFKRKESPEFQLVFPPDTLPLNDIDTDSSCRLSINQSNDPVTLIAKIDALEEDRILHLTGQEPIRPELLREYFRVSLRSKIVASYQPGPRETRSKPWTMTGETIDLSGGGVLALFPGKPENRRNIRLEIDLPTQSEPAVCMAEVVRTYRMRKKKYQAALHFTDIEQKTRDQIISCCLQEQRRQLREKIRVE
ncbi:PilZ domain-containing protein [Desulfolithobacter sp.]